MDMEIDGDNVYFCGNESSNHAFVGQFDVLGCFYGTAQFYYCVIPGALPYPVEMNTATKMTTMEYGGQKYILGLGDATHDYSDPTPYVASNLFSATMYPGGFWFFRVDYQKVCPYRYTDIDCSDNYVVVTAVDANDYVHILPCYHNPDYFYHNYFVYTGENLPIPGTQCFNYRSVAISSVSFVPEMVFLSNHYPCNENNPTTLFTPEILPLEPKTICE